ncbi:MAG: hypothetical protein ACR2GL_00695 [Thermoleophilaceae bacterium]
MAALTVYEKPTCTTCATRQTSRDDAPREQAWTLGDRRAANVPG